MTQNNKFRRIIINRFFFIEGKISEANRSTAARPTKNTKRTENREITFKSNESNLLPAKYNNAVSAIHSIQVNHAFAYPLSTV